MANISALLEIIRTAHLGRDMRQALHDSIRDVNNDTENALGKSLTFVTATRKLSLKAKDGSTLSEVVIPGGGSGGGSVDSVNGVLPDANGNVEVNLNDINDVNITSAANGQILKYDETSGKWVNGNGGGGGTSDYTDLTNKPQINGVTLSGNKTSADLGIAYSNPNLIDNAWFTVNTKGFSSGNVSVNSSFIDKWETIFDSANLEITNQGLKINNQTNYFAVIQRLDIPVDYDNVYTLSMMTADGQIYTKTGKFSNSTTGESTVISTPFPVALGMWTSAYKLTVAIYLDGNSSTESITVKALKLELGSQSTLALDIAPNYELENIRCGNGANKSDITSIVATGTTNNTGNTITNGQLFYLNGTLCKALSNIASGSAFTLNTNYKVNNLNNEIKTKYIDYVYENATTSGTQYTISNAKSTVFGLSSGNIIYGLAPRRATGNDAMGILQLAYDATNDELIFISTANNSNYTVLQFVVLYV